MIKGLLVAAPGYMCLSELTPWCRPKAVALSLYFPLFLSLSPLISQPSQPGGFPLREGKEESSRQSAAASPRIPALAVPDTSEMGTGGQPSVSTSVAGWLDQIGEGGTMRFFFFFSSVVQLAFRVCRRSLGLAFPPYGG
ncbi:hypothetical protein LZ32DRAFT_198086 [Colletotrichum eremochloae]|nr:hypothetical protein LZ32DRAFT_198086 [Colletotrichum eremochloae]